MTARPEDVAAARALADAIMSISYRYAVAMHESIDAGRGATGWNEVEHSAEIVDAIGTAFEAAKDAAYVAYEAGRREALEQAAEVVRENARAKWAQGTLGYASLLSALRRLGEAKP